MLLGYEYYKVYIEMGLFKVISIYLEFSSLRGFLEYFVRRISDLCLNFLGCIQLFIQQTMLQVQRCRDD